MKADAVGDETDRLEAELAEFLQKLSIDLGTACARLDQVHDEIFALDQIGPDFILLGCRIADHRGAANAGKVAVFLAEDFHANDIAALQFPIGRTDVGKLAALAGRDDHQLVALRAAAEKRSQQSARELHLAHADSCRPERIAERFIGKLAERAQQRELGRRFDLPRLIENRIRAGPLNAGKSFLQASENP